MINSQRVIHRCEHTVHFIFHGLTYLVAEIIRRNRLLHRLCLNCVR